ncbi:MAG TPA: hypothetical protein VFX89_15895 [Gammaproteobacteria bacterium]|nr:hypothetical protein [Gammaproteobacteria bacterium]
MRKPKEQDEETDETQFFDDFDSGDDSDDDDDESGDDSRKSKKPARQRVELRNEQQTLRRQLSDWDDYEQDDFDTKL